LKETEKRVRRAERDFLTAFGGKRGFAELIVRGLWSENGGSNREGRLSKAFCGEKRVQ
jgi:hypothetical protein